MPPTWGVSGPSRHACVQQLKHAFIAELEAEALHAVRYPGVVRTGVIIVAAMLITAEEAAIDILLSALCAVGFEASKENVKVIPALIVSVFPSCSVRMPAL